MRFRFAGAITFFALAAGVSGCNLRAHGDSAVEGIAIQVHGKSPFATIRYSMPDGALSYDVIIARNPDCTGPIRKLDDNHLPTLHIPALTEGVYHACITASLPGGLRRAARNTGLPFEIKGVAETFGGAASPRQPAEIHPLDSGLLVAEPFRGQVFFWKPFAPEGESEEFTFAPKFVDDDQAARGNFRDPYSACAADDGTLYVSDLYNHRVLVFDSVSGSPPSRVLGQTDLSGVTPGDAKTQLNSPHGLSCRFGKLVIADSGNDRVLIWNSTPRSSAQPPDVIVGGHGAPSALTLNSPSSVFFDGRRLFVSDAGHHRILAWSHVPESSGTPADIVLGQADFESALANRGGGVSAEGLSFPGQLFSGGDKLFAVDSANHRVVMWLSALENGLAAEAILGQPTFTSAEPDRSPLGLNGPSGLTVSDGYLIVADARHYRLLRVALDGAFSVKGEFVPPRSRFAIPGMPSTERLLR